MNLYGLTPHQLRKLLSCMDEARDKIRNDRDLTKAVVVHDGWRVTALRIPGRVEPEIAEITAA